MKNKRILLGMSGGVDSSVAAVLLKDQGYDVVGCTFQFVNNSLSERDISQVKDLVRKLQIKHCFIDLTKEFETEVISYFINGYQSGQTPFPCAVCNPMVKWKNLIRQADNYECNYVSTGHYVINTLYKNNNYIFKGVDPEKDQSFFLWGLNSEILKRSLFPLGKLMKYEVRDIAEKNGFKKLSQKKDSLGICFLHDKNYRSFMSDKIRISSGNFVDSEGNILGKHSGYINYTIGQRRGLGINFNTPLFVSEIRPQTNEVVLSDFKELFKNQMIVVNYFFVKPEEISPEKILNVRIRYRNQNTPCTIEIVNYSELKVELLKPLESIAPGQTAVFYDNDRVLGGGYIKSAV
ncbi:MAG: tRNA 2-thiouridine(34) synthase MnmA [Prolixibacteraceae bacterium]|nr:tRNA 2-thiouridine(34) synthase MnmA [Prolixibacteraceae bacterium]